MADDVDDVNKSVPTTTATAATVAATIATVDTAVPVDSFVEQSNAANLLSEAEVIGRFRVKNV